MAKKDDSNSYIDTEIIKLRSNMRDIINEINQAVLNKYKNKIKVLKKESKLVSDRINELKSKKTKR